MPGSHHAAAPLHALCPHCGGPLLLPHPAGAPSAAEFHDILAALKRIESMTTQTQAAETSLAASIDKLREDLSGKLQVISAKLQSIANSTGDADTAAALASLQGEVDAMDAQVTSFDPDAPPADTAGGAAGEPAPVAEGA